MLQRDLSDRLLIIIYLLTTSLQEGEPVEFTPTVDERGRIKAERVTGPMGAFVQGAPRRTFQAYDNDNVRGGGFKRNSDYDDDDFDFEKSK